MDIFLKINRSVEIAQNKRYKLFQRNQIMLNAKCITVLVNLAFTTGDVMMIDVIRINGFI